MWIKNLNRFAVAAARCVWAVARQAVNAQQTEASSGDISRIRRGAGAMGRGLELRAELERFSRCE